MTSTELLLQKGKQAKSAAHQMAQASTEMKNKALQLIAKGLIANKESILAFNQQDLESAKEAGLDAAMLDRSSLMNRLEGISADIQTVIDLSDPVGEVFDKRTLPNGLDICKQRTPIGVIGVIYEARPNVTVDIAVLTIKTGNCAILRGGSETLRTNLALVSVIKNALKEAGLPPEAIQFIESPDRGLVLTMLKMHDCVDMIIPRGGAKLHQFCRENSTIPVITGGIGICHLFADESANLDASLKVIHNAKTQRPTVCNALDTLLIHEKIAASFLPRVLEFLGSSGVSFKLDKKAWALIQQGKTAPGLNLQTAQEEDWNTEWLSLILGIKIVKDLDEAIKHIQEHSTGHSDGILTTNNSHADQFVQQVDSAAVYVNASTRFTDGGQLGLGAEVAISTQKLHARGPMGLPELTSYKWVIRGNNQIR